jgi:endonuclease/exonuclease/phosphatase family metal-dependent hydrolase
MGRPLRLLIPLAMGSVWLLSMGESQAETFRVATYNLAGYTDHALPGRQAKSAESKRAVHQMIQAMRPDVIALQEVGCLDALLELRASLRSHGLDLPHWELVAAADTNIHLAVLSRFPFTARRPHTNDMYLLGGRRFRVGRGFAEVEVQVNPSYSFTLISAHLKSRRPVLMTDESEQRLEEARLLRDKIDARLLASPQANVIVVGDLNDTPASDSTRLVLGRGRMALMDVRPTEWDPGGKESAVKRSTTVAWTYYYSKEDTYTRVDYILLSRGMAPEWLAEESYVLAADDWAKASDHRPVVACFVAEEK